LIVSDIDMRMMDVSGKPVTARQAVAAGIISMRPRTYKAIENATLPKGDALSTAKIAGIMAAKATPSLIPMCHPLLIEEITLDYEFLQARSSIQIKASVKGQGKTGYEMEALTAVTVAALTIYDMCKSIDPSMKIAEIRLLQKSGGKSGTVVLE
jgi:cyclic pyranopterin phosphate synthase